MRGRCARIVPHPSVRPRGGTSPGSNMFQEYLLGILLVVNRGHVELNENLDHVLNI